MDGENQTQEPIIDVNTPTNPVSIVPIEERPKKKAVRYPLKNTRQMKKKFVKNLIETSGNRTKAYLKTFPGTAQITARQKGPVFFKDPEVQEIWQAAGVDVPYLAHKAKYLMDNADDNVSAGLVKHFTKPLLQGDNVQRKESVTVTLFGELTSGAMQMIREGKKITLKEVKNGRQGQRTETETEGPDTN